MTHPARRFSNGRSTRNTRIGHVHLKVADIERALAFYCGVLGFSLVARYGTEAAFIARATIIIISASTRGRAEGGSPPARGDDGTISSRHTLSNPPPLSPDALRRLATAGIALDGASDHGVSEALYLRDPDENGVELYWDRPHELWPKAGRWRNRNVLRRLDLEGLLKETV